MTCQGLTGGRLRCTADAPGLVGRASGSPSVRTVTRALEGGFGCSSILIGGLAQRRHFQRGDGRICVSNNSVNVADLVERRLVKSEAVGSIPAPAVTAAARSAP